MSYFEDQEEDWLANDCKGRIEDYDGAGNYTPSEEIVKPKTEVQKARRTRAKARRRERDRQVEIGGQ